MTKKQIIAELKKHQKVMAESRNGLQEILEEVQEQFDNAADAYWELEACIEKLSELI